MEGKCGSSSRRRRVPYTVEKTRTATAGEGRRGLGEMQPSGGIPVAKLDGRGVRELTTSSSGSSAPFPSALHEQRRPGGLRVRPLLRSWSEAPRAAKGAPVYVRGRAASQLHGSVASTPVGASGGAVPRGQSSLVVDCMFAPDAGPGGLAAVPAIRRSPSGATSSGRASSSGSRRWRRGPSYRHIQSDGASHGSDDPASFDAASLLP